MTEAQILITIGIMLHLTMNYGHEKGP